MSLACWRFTPFPPTVLTECFSSRRRRGFRYRAFAEQDLAAHGADGPPNKKETKKVVVVGSGWAGFGAAHHLCNQGFDVTVLETGNDLGGVDDVGIRGYWYPYQNIFSLVDELGIKPFTYWTKIAQYSAEGLEVEFPVFQDLPQLPTPLGTLLYTQFAKLPLVDRLTSLPLTAAGKNDYVLRLHERMLEEFIEDSSSHLTIHAISTHLCLFFTVVDFDNTDTAWRKYDSITARELFKQLGCSERLYQNVLSPLLQVGLFAPAEQCSAAATLGLLSYILAHQKDFDLVWCRGTSREKIFEPWMASLTTKGCKFEKGIRVTDFLINEETGSISEVVCGKEVYNADAVVLAVGIPTLQKLIENSAVLCTREEFLKVLNLASIDVLSVKLWLDRKVNIPNASNACSGIDDSFGWTFFDLNAIHDDHKDSPVTVLQADFYHANELLPMKNEQIVSRVTSYLSKYINNFKDAIVTNKEIGRFPNSLTHFFPGSYKDMMRGSTSYPNLFMAGDWIITRHGSCSQEKSYVTGLEAANRTVDYLEEGSLAKIIPVEEDEPHIQALRSFNRRFNEIRTKFPLSSYFLQ